MVWGCGGVNSGGGEPAVMGDMTEAATAAAEGSELRGGEEVWGNVN